MSGHFVQFYEKESFLSGVVADFLGEGISGGQQAVVIATPPHRRAFADELAARGVQADDGRLILLDAEETLALFMDGGQPDERRFKAVVGGVLEPRARAYGEMVDVLSRAGNVDAAIRLEELWNDVVDERKISLLCAYPIDTFAKHSDREAFERICDRHSGVRPAESAASPAEVALLQQRAAALNDERAFLLEAAEVLHRSLDYETRLRELSNLIVPRFAERCEIDIVRGDGSCDRFAEGQLVLHVSPGAELAEALRTGEVRVREKRVIVPMKISGRTLGAIVLTSPAAPSDAGLALLNELARRSAVAIENSRLYRMAHEANRAKDAFLATLSHELRTPLTTILGWAHMLRLGPLSADVTAAALETIERSAKTQAALIDDIFDISKVVTGKVSLETAPVDLAGVVDGAIDTVRLAAAAKRVRLELARPEMPAIVTGDATRLQQIAWNLLSNAIKFSPPDSEVRVAVTRDGTNAKLTVRDHGAGIPRDFLPHVFEAFRQAEASSTRTFGGLGLGLAIVKSFTELHGGTVSAESSGEGAGATFTVALPLAPASS